MPEELSIIETEYELANTGYLIDALI